MLSIWFLVTVPSAILVSCLHSFYHVTSLLIASGVSFLLSHPPWVPQLGFQCSIIRHNPANWNYFPQHPIGNSQCILHPGSLCFLLIASYAPTNDLPHIVTIFLPSAYQNSASPSRYSLDPRLSTQCVLTSPIAIIFSLEFQVQTPNFILIVPWLCHHVGLSSTRWQGYKQQKAWMLRCGFPHHTKWRFSWVSD